MRYITRREATAYEPGEDLYTVEVNAGSIIIVADLEENLNLYGDEEGYDDEKCRYRVEVYDHGDWTLDPELIADPHESAIGEQRGLVAGGITFYFEDSNDWFDYPDVYACLFDIVRDANEEVALLDDVTEVFDLPDGVWHVIVPAGSCF